MHLNRLELALDHCRAFLGQAFIFVGDFTIFLPFFSSLLALGIVFFSFFMKALGINIKHSGMHFADTFVLGTAVLFVGTKN